jgi:DNA polymerase-3 subunit epsilon
MDWVAFDLETTGLPPTSRPVEIGARRFRSDGIVEDFSVLVNPGIPIPGVVQAIHGIDDAMVADAIDVPTALERFLSFAEGAALVAHNASFDAGILASNAERLGIPLPETPVYCSVRMTRRLVPRMWSYRLSSIVRTLGIEHEGFHRAHPDAVLVGRLVQRLMAMGSSQLIGFPLVGPGCLGGLRSGFGAPRPLPLSAFSVATPAP